MSISKEILIQTEKSLTEFIEACEGNPEYKEGLEAAYELRLSIQKELIGRQE